MAVESGAAKRIAVFAFYAALLGSGWLAIPRDEVALTASIFGAAALLALWHLGLVWVRRGEDDPFRIQPNIQTPHYVQGAIQAGHYVYWGLYWDGVQAYAPLIAVQLLFAYLFQMLMSWSRGQPWRLGFGPFPIVLSINLFLWFRPEYFYLQFLLIALAFVAKEYVTWTVRGERTHIFNPSAFALSVAGLVLMTTGSVPLIFGLDQIVSFYLPPNFYEVMFLLGLILQVAFGTTLITLGSALSLTLLFFGFQFALGATLTPEPIDVVVFLGLNLLVTDPATSPRSNVGKLLFGLAYGCGIFAAYAALRYLRQPSYFDKILLVPVVNVLVVLFETAGLRVQTWLGARSWIPAIRHDRLVYVALYSALFLAVVPYLKSSPENVINLPPRAGKPSPRIAELYREHGRFCIKYPDACEPFGFRAEATYFRQARQLAPDTAEAHNNLALAQLSRGRFDLAIAEFRRALRRQPAYAEARLNLARALQSRDLFGEASSHFRRLLAQEPASFEARFGLGTILLSEGRLDLAEAQLSEALRARPDSVEVLNNLGTIFLLREDLEAAAGYYRRALEINPRFAHAHSNSAEVLLARGRLEEAIDPLRQALEIDPDNPDVHVRLAEVFASLGRARDATRHFRRALEIDPDHAEARSALDLRPGADP